MKLPVEILKALKAAEIQINLPYQFQIIEVKPELKRPNIFNSYEIGNYKTTVFRYIITVPKIEGEIILEKSEKNTRIIKNTLTLMTCT